MPLHPEIKAMLAEAAALGGATISELDIKARRAAELVALDPAAGEPVRMVKPVKIRHPGGSVPARIYWPDGDPPLPVLVAFHGGGFVCGSIESYDAFCRVLTNAARCITISVGYRLAPESPFPAALKDAYAAVEWAASNAERMGGDPDRLAVGGNSAGGNLAAAVSLLARERSGPPLHFQWLIYPVLAKPGSTHSYTENAQGYGLTSEEVAFYWRQYLSDEEHEDDPLAAPLVATDLRGLPPAFIATAEFDPLRDDGELYAHRLWEAGVNVTLRRYEGMNHGFFGIANWHAGAQNAVDEAAGALRAALWSNTSSADVDCSPARDYNGIVIESL